MIPPKEKRDHHPLVIPLEVDGMMARTCNREEVLVSGKSCNNDSKQKSFRGVETASCAPDNSVHRSAETGSHDKESKQGKGVGTQRSLSETQDLTRRESLVILRLKRILVFVLLCFASAVATLTYVVLKGKQHKNYIDAVSAKAPNINVQTQFGPSTHRALGRFHTVQSTSVNNRNCAVFSFTKHRGRNGETFRCCLC
jgi:hypothetical protein